MSFAEATFQSRRLAVPNKDWWQPALLVVVISVFAFAASVIIAQRAEINDLQARLDSIEAKANLEYASLNTTLVNTCLITHGSSSSKRVHQRCAQAANLAAPAMLASSEIHDLNFTDSKRFTTAMDYIDPRWRDRGPWD